MALCWCVGVGVWRRRRWSRCERASDYDFNSLREKKQLIGRNPKISIIGNKLKLNKTMREFHQKGRRPKAARVPSQRQGTKNASRSVLTCRRRSRWRTGR